MFNYDRHVASVHSIVKETFSCHKCEKSYSRKDHYERHVNSCSQRKSKHLRNKSTVSYTDEFFVNTLAVESCIYYGAMNLESADENEVCLILQL